MIQLLFASHKNKSQVFFKKKVLLFFLSCLLNKENVVKFHDVEKKTLE